MSAGPFTNSSYETVAGPVHPIVIQPETQALILGGATNDPPAGPITNEITAYTRKPKNRYGLGARNVRLSWTDPAAPPTGYQPYQTFLVPILTPGLFDAVTVGTTGTYLGVGVTVVSKLPEDIN